MSETYTFGKSMETMNYRLSAIVCFINLILASVVGAESCPEYFQQCRCNKTAIICVDQKLSNSSGLQFLSRDKPGVAVIVLTGNTFTDVSKNLFGDCSGNKTRLRLMHLRHLDLSHNNIQTIHGKSFHCVPKLRNLILDHNDWTPSHHVRVFTDLLNLRRLSLVNAFLESLNGHRHLTRLSLMFNISDPYKEPGLSRLEYLNLASNEFWTVRNVTSQAFCRLINLKVLILSNNNLGSADIDTCMQKLETFDLSDNRIVYMTKHLMTVLPNLPNLKRVYLGRNDYACDCHTVPFYKWLNTTNVPIVDRSSITCKVGFYTTYQGRRLDSLSTKDLKCVDHRPNALGTYIVLSVVLTAIVTFVAFMLINNRKYIKTLWLKFRSHGAMNFQPFRDQQYSSVNTVSAI